LRAGARLRAWCDTRILHAWRRNDLRSVFRLFEVNRACVSVRLPSVFSWWWRYVTGAGFSECMRFGCACAGWPVSCR